MNQSSETPSLWVLYWRRIKRYLTQPHIIICLLLTVVLVALVLTPLLELFRGAFTYHRIDLRRVQDATEGAFTTYQWEKLMMGPTSKQIFYRPLLNSVVTSLGASFVGLSIGMSLAWLVVRSDIPYRGTLSKFGVIPFLMPSWVLANAWIVFLKNRSIGGHQGLFQFITGVAPPNFLAYGALPIMVVLGIHYSSFSFLFISAALGSIDSQLEEAGVILGASRTRLLRSITFPIILPAVFTSFVLTFTRSLGNFGTPHFLGAPVGYRTLAVTLYSQVTFRQYGGAWAIAILLIVSTVLLVSYSRKFSKRGERYQTISGKSSRQRRTKLGRWRKPIFVIVVVLVISIIIVPTGLFLYQSLMKRAGDFSLQNITFHYWIGASDPNIADGQPGVLRQPQIMGALWNTLKLGFFSALFGSFLGIMLGYGVKQGKGDIIATIPDQLSFIPYLMPSIAIGAIFVAMFGKPIGPIPALYGTFSILVLGMVVKNLPFASRAGISSMMQIGDSLEEAAHIQGASWAHTFRRIIAPLAIGGFITGFVLTLIIGMKELDLVVLLTTAGNEVLSTKALALAEQGGAQFESATIFLQLTCIYTVVALSTKLLRVDISKGLRM